MGQPISSEANAAQTGKATQWGHINSWVFPLEVQRRSVSLKGGFGAPDTSPEMVLPADSATSDCACFNVWATG